MGLFHNKIACAIVANGWNPRMNLINKEFIKLEGCSILDSVLKEVKLLFDEIIIVTDKADDFKKYKDLKIVPDVHKELA